MSFIFVLSSNVYVRAPRVLLSTCQGKPAKRVPLPIVSPEFLLPLKGYGFKSSVMGGGGKLKKRE